MVRYSGAWDEDGVAAFLAEAVVPVRLAVRTPDGPLWMLSLWFDYREGSLWCATSADADVVAYVEADGDVAFEVSTNDPPYRGVRGNGTATVLPDGDALLRDLLERYLGGTDSPLARRLLDPAREEVRVRVDPRRVHSWDFTDRMRESVAAADSTDGGETPPPGATVDPGRSRGDEGDSTDPDAGFGGRGYGR